MTRPRSGRAGGSSIQDVEALGKAAEPALIEAIEQAPSLLNGLRNVWCYSGLFGDRLFLIHCVQTEA